MNRLNGEFFWCDFTLSLPTALMKTAILDLKFAIRLLNNKFHGLSPSGSHHSLLFDQGFPNNAQLQLHLADQNAIYQYFVSMRLYLAMMFILSMNFLPEKK